MESAAQTTPSLHIDRSQALHFLGHQGQDVSDALVERVERMCAHCERVSQPRWLYRIFPIEHGQHGVLVQGTTIVLEGSDIAAHLDGARSCAIMTATCGLANERELQRLANSGGVDALLFDAAGSALAEAAADACNAQIVEEAHALGLHANWRYGPGYGDLPLDVQPAIIRVLGADKYAGLTATDANLLVPAKSITAIVGLFDEPQDSHRSCNSCSFSDFCNLKKAGTPCYR